MAARLLAGGGIALDQAFTSEPFSGQRGDIIRASLLARLRHSASALCLYGARTPEDDGVRWALKTAADLRLPLLGASLPGVIAPDSEWGLSRLGVEIVPLDREAILADKFGRVKPSGTDAQRGVHRRDAALHASPAPLASPPPATTGQALPLSENDQIPPACLRGIQGFVGTGDQRIHGLALARRRPG